VALEPGPLAGVVELPVPVHDDQPQSPSARVGHRRDRQERAARELVAQREPGLPEQAGHGLAVGPYDPSQLLVCAPGELAQGERLAVMDGQAPVRLLDGQPVRLMNGQPRTAGVGIVARFPDQLRGLATGHGEQVQLRLATKREERRLRRACGGLARARHAEAEVEDV
jgi:hypothetical protein